MDPVKGATSVGLIGIAYTASTPHPAVAATAGVVSIISSVVSNAYLDHNDYTTAQIIQEAKTQMGVVKNNTQTSISNKVTSATSLYTAERSEILNSSDTYLQKVLQARSLKSEIKGMLGTVVDAPTTKSLYGELILEFARKKNLSLYGSHNFSGPNNGFWNTESSHGLPWNWDAWDIVDELNSIDYIPAYVEYGERYNVN